MEFAQRNNYEAVMDLREIRCKTRNAITPYIMTSMAHERSLMAIDQLVFGEDLSPEVVFSIGEDQYKKWWLQALAGIGKSMKVIFLTGCSEKKIKKGDCLAAQIARKIKPIKIGHKTRQGRRSISKPKRTH